MEVLAWLDDQSLEWDITSTCRRAPFATAFARWQTRRHSRSSSSMRRKGELSAAAIDHGWPHQVVLPARLCEGNGYNEIHEFCRDLTLCSRGHALYHDGQWFHVDCLRSQRMRKSSWKDLMARSSIPQSAASAPIGRGGKQAASGK
jgi:hypothetical protein